MQNRDNTFDIVKGIAIILMVVGHSGCPTTIRNFIYLFHMPIFYFVSGYFFNEKYIHTKTAFIRRKLSQLYKPFVVYGLSFLFLSKIFFKLHIIDYNYSFSKIITRFFSICLFKENEILLAPFWFLRSLFIVSVIFLLIRYISHFFKKNDLTSIIIILFLFTFGIILSIKHIILPLQFQREIIVLLFYSMGYYSHKYKFPITFNKTLLLPVFPFLLYLAISTEVDLVSCKFNNIFSFMIGSALGIYFLLTLSKNITVPILAKIFSFLGKNTIPILALHFISFKIVSILIIYQYNLSINKLLDFPIINEHNIPNQYWLLYSLIGVTIPIISDLSFRLLKKITLKQ